MIRLALTKGRIEQEAIKLIAAAGYDCSSLEKDARGRKLLFNVGDGKIEVVLAKAADVITYVEHGVCDIGIVGRDTIMESTGVFYEIADLGFGKCRFALAGMKGRDFYDGYSHKVIATKYPNVAKSYFTKKGIDVEVVKIDGSVELAPLLRLSDAIVDIVETGKTLVENGLEVKETIASVSARLILNPVCAKLKNEEAFEFIGKLKNAIKE